MEDNQLNKKKIPLDEPSLEGNEKKYLNECIDTNWISWQGAFVEKTESSLAKYCNSKHCLTIVNGTYALILALKALGIGPGDEVIVPALTMSATAFAVTEVEAKIIWADSSKHSFVIDPEDVAKKITPKTKAVMAVHLYGQPVDMESLLKVTEPKGIHIIEDVAEALGAVTSNKKVGGVGTISCHSFHNKIIASGEGGAITTNSEEIKQKIEELRTPPPNNNGSKVIALNNRMSNISCAVALAQLERIEELIDKRRKVAKLYDQHFKNSKGIEIFQEKEDQRWVYWRYQISLTKDYPLTKEELVEKLKRHNIEARPVFTLVCEHNQYKSEFLNDCPNAVETSATSIDLPSGPHLTEEQVNYVADLIVHPEKL